MLRELYALMAVLEAEQEALRDEGEEERPQDDEAVLEGLFLEGVRPLIEADARFAPLADEIRRGVSKVRVRFSSHGHGRDAQEALVRLRESGQYAEANKQYAQWLAEVPVTGKFWLDWAENEQSWAASEAKAGRKGAARAHLALAATYTKQARTLNAKSLRYQRVLTSIEQALNAVGG